MISQSSIERVISAANIVEVIGRDVSLKRSGVNHKACCPFHNEATPSFVVNEVKQIFKCFGCGEGGGLVKYMMLKHSLSFPEAIRELAKQYNIELEYERENDQGQEKRVAEEKHREALLYVNEMAARYFAAQLTGTEPAMAYLSSRMHDDDIAAWHLGWAMEGWDNLLNHFREKGVQDDIMLASGLIRESEKTGKLYDCFRARVIFPIHNIAGRVVGFAGRIIDNVSGEPKYINSQESIIYNKSHVLYGMQHAFRAIRDADSCNLVEGYTDVIAMHRAGISNTVAACGTSVTEQQLRQIGRYTKRLVMVGDGDSAGTRSMLRAGTIATKLGMRVDNTMLPTQRDPYDIIQHYHV